MSATKTQPKTQWKIEEIQALPSMGLVENNRTLRLLAWVLVAMFFFFIAVLIVTPWQQNVPGAGRVIALTPLERQQSIDAPVDGRVIKWHVIEGSKVKKGDPIVDIADNDPEIISRLRNERDAVARRLEEAARRVSSLEERIRGLEGSRRNALDAGSSRIQMAAQAVEAASRSLDAAEANQVTAKLNIDRVKELAKKGLNSTRQRELAELEWATATANVDRSKASLQAAINDKMAREADQAKIETDFKAMIEDARASLATGRAEIANANGELQRTEVRLARQTTQSVTAPRDGTIFRLVAQPGSELLKAGEPVAILVPDLSATTVELYVSGNDMPLLSEGVPVRLQFEGWPAIQFVGWPSVAVGTFGGRVALVDATDNGQGLFRVLVNPDPNDDPWPSKAYLRQGVRTNGWFLLRQVPLWFELWRQFNGFPVAVANVDPAKEVKAGKDGGKGGK